MLQHFNLYDIISTLDEIAENGDMYGYEREEDGESGYYQDYKEQFDELSAGAYGLWEALQDSDLRDNWDDMTVALLGKTQTVLGFDIVEQDYFHMLNRFDEEYAVEKAAQRIERLTKRDMIRCFRKVMVTLLLFFDIKASHDCLTSIVEELDARAAVLRRMYQDITNSDGSNFDKAIANLPDRAWVE